MESFIAMMIIWNLDYIHSAGVDIVCSLNLQTVTAMPEYFLYVLMFKWIHDLALNYLCDMVTMRVDIHGYDTRSSGNVDVHVPRVTRQLQEKF